MGRRLAIARDSVCRHVVNGDYDISGCYKIMRVITLTKGFVAVISAKHFRRVNRHKWHVHFSKGKKKKTYPEPYARATINGRKVYLHRFIKEEEILHKILEGCTDNESFWHVDHKNHQTLDCRDDNLKVCSYVENLSTRRNLKKNKKQKKAVDISMCESHIECATKQNNESEKEEKNANIVCESRSGLQERQQGFV